MTERRTIRRTVRRVRLLAVCLVCAAGFIDCGIWDDSEAERR
jgi:hypothetical protein